ncbi:MAG: hypothetical protein R3249_11405 [Nitriliruptorales bacterium]|nr:hypothetical protein [Nitriliruptorales bacterium]
MAAPSRKKLAAARGLVAFVVVAPIVALALGHDHPDTGGWEALLAFGMANLALATLALLLIRRKDHPVGWLLLAVGASGALQAAAFSYATHGAVGSDPLGTLPGAVPAQWVSEQLWLVQIVGQALLIPLLFPDGRLPSRRWRHVLRMIVVGAVFGWIPLLLAPTLYIDESIAAPLARLAPPDPISGALVAVGGMLVAFGLVAVIVSLVVRWRRGDPLERQQLKWLFAGLIPLILTQILVGALDIGRDGIGDLLLLLSYIALPVSMTVAILQYRLYDLGRLIRRTAGYAIVSALLVGIYALAVISLSSLAPTGGSSLSVALATLVTAVLARPAHQRIKQWLDRRFNRQAYDAERALEALRSRLSSQLEVTAVMEELLAIATDSVEPEVASVWVRAETKAATS